MDQPTVPILHPEISISWPPLGSKVIYNRRHHEGNCHLLAIDTWRFLPCWDTSLCAMVEKVLKHQCWLWGGLMCTDLLPICHVNIRGSTEFSKSEYVCHLNFWNSLVLPWNIKWLSKELHTCSPVNRILYRTNTNTQLITVLSYTTQPCCIPVLTVHNTNNEKQNQQWNLHITTTYSNVSNKMMTETMLTSNRKAGCPTFCALPELQADLQTRTLNCKQSTLQRTSTDFKPPHHLFRYLWLCDFPKCHILYSLKQQKLISA